MAGLAQMEKGDFLSYAGMETDLIFNHGIDLPGFASFPLLESRDGRARLEGYCEALIALGRRAGMGVILESPTWVANRDRGGPIGYSPEMLRALNIEAIELIDAVRKAHGDLPTILSGNIGPRSDAYAPASQMTATEAEDYHAEQIGALASTAVDVVSAYTLAYPNEAIGIVQAAKRFELPVVVSFTVETDGKLPTGASLVDAISEVDQATDGFAAYFMINCAHPDHFEAVLNGAASMGRLKGIIANASRCSHAELDAATVLDAGNPTELGAQLRAIRARHPNITVLDGCCGTDMRHMAAIAGVGEVPISQ